MRSTVNTFRGTVVRRLEDLGPADAGVAGARSRRRLGHYGPGTDVRGDAHQGTRCMSERPVDRTGIAHLTESTGPWQARERPVVGRSPWQTPRSTRPASAAAAR